jgi:hypothetical protein
MVNPEGMFRSVEFSVPLSPPCLTHTIFRIAQTVKML